MRDNMFKKMLAQGDGARFFIRFQWSNSSGHAFNAEVRNGVVYIIDAQQAPGKNIIGTSDGNLKNELGVDAFDNYISACSPSGCEFVRTDNCHLNIKNLNKAVTNKRR